MAPVEDRWNLGGRRGGEKVGAAPGSSAAVVRMPWWAGPWFTSRGRSNSSRESVVGRAHRTRQGGGAATVRRDGGAQSARQGVGQQRRGGRGGHVHLAGQGGAATVRRLLVGRPVVHIKGTGHQSEED